MTPNRAQHSNSSSLLHLFILVTTASVSSDDFAMAIGTAVLCWSASCTIVISQAWLAAMQTQLAAWRDMYTGPKLVKCCRAPWPHEVLIRFLLHRLSPRATTPLWDGLDSICASLGTCTGTQKARLAKLAALCRKACAAAMLIYHTCCVVSCALLLGTCSRGDATSPPA